VTRAELSHLRAAVALAHQDVPVPEEVWQHLSTLQWAHIHLNGQHRHPLLLDEYSSATLLLQEVVLDQRVTEAYKR